MNYPDALVQRFWAKVDRSGGPDVCWPWFGARKTTGYGNFCIERRGQTYNKTVLAHRFAYELIHGPIPGGLMACHTCDNPSCCNPSHIFIGNNRTNMQDAVAKGRKNFSEMARKAGQKITNGTKIAKLTNDQVIAIIREYEAGTNCSGIALKYGVLDSTISRIARGKTYRWVPEVNAKRETPTARYNAQRTASRLAKPAKRAASKLLRNALALAVQTPEDAEIAAYWRSYDAQRAAADPEYASWVNASAGKTAQQEVDELFPA